MNDRLYVGYDRESTSIPTRPRRIAITMMSAAAMRPVRYCSTRRRSTPANASGNKFTFAGSTGYMQTAIVYYNPFSQFIFEQHGNLLKFDFSNLANPVSGELFTAFAPSATPLDNQPDSGGPHLRLIRDRCGHARAAGDHHSHRRQLCCRCRTPAGG